MGNDAVDFDTAWNLLKVVGAGGRGSARESANALPRRASPGGTLFAPKGGKDIPY